MARFGHAASTAALLLAMSASGSGQAQSVQTDYGYDVQGRLVKVTRPGATTEYTYDKAQNRTRVKTTAANNPPTSATYTLDVPASGAYQYDPRNRHSDADGDPMTISGATASASPKGTLANTSTSITYTPNPGQAGQTDTFTYSVLDGKGGVGSGTVTVNIQGTIQLPAAQNTVANITPDANGNVASYSLPLSFTGGTPSSVSASTPSAGTATPASNNSILYSSNGWSGQTSLQYTGTNGAGTGSPGTITVNVKPVIGNVTGLTANAGQSKTFSLSGYAKTSGVTSMSLPNGAYTAKGEASFSGTTLTYKPNANATGDDTFAYTATSAGGTSTSANITVSIQSCSLPVAGTTSAIVNYNSASNVIPLNISGGTPTSVNYVTGSSHGSVQAIGTTMYYSPFQGYSGPDSFTYNATNACGTSSPATGYITVNPPPNRAPVANVDYVTIAANSYAYFDPRTNDSDPDGDPLTLVSVTPASYGGATWTNSNNYISYVPPANFSGNDYFYYTISDGRGGTSQSWVQVTVNPPPPNNPPTANPGTTDPVWQSTTVNIDPRANDTDPNGDALTIQSIDNFYFAYGRINGVDRSGASQAPADIGSVTNNGTSITYRAPFLSNSGSAGSNYIAVVVWYTISDGKGGTSQSYQIINVYGPS